MVVSPGLEFLVRSSIHLCLPSAFIYAAILLGCNLLSLSSPRWILVVSTIAMRVGYIFARPWFDEYRNAQIARAHGATLVPHIKERHIDVARSLLREQEHGYPGESFETWSRKYGHFYRFSIGLDERFFTSEPEHVKAMLATQFESFAKGPIVFEQAKSLLGTGVFNSDGDMWKFHRSITRPFFVRDRITDFDIFERHTEDAIKRAKDRLAEGYPIDFQDLVSRFTLDSATEFLFNNDVHCLSAGIPYPSYPSPLAKPNPPSFTNHPSNEFAKAFMLGQELGIHRVHIGTFWPLAEMWGDAIAPSRATMDKFVDRFMEKGFHEKEKKQESDNVPDSLLDHLLTQTSDRDIIRDELINLLVAGRDTTASLLTFSVYMIIEHPSIRHRLRKEILDKVGAKRAPTVDDIKEMRFLRAFLNEVLRLYAVVPLNARMATKPVVLAPATGSNSPVYIPAGSMFLYSVLLMHRRKDLWGPDALEFDPDRFLDERVHKYLVSNPFIFCPFNAGPRICLGQQFAYNESSFFLVRLLQQFSSFSLEDDARPLNSFPKPEWAQYEGPQGKDKIRPRTHLTMYINGGLWVRMKETLEGEADA